MLIVLRLYFIILSTIHLLQGKAGKYTEYSHLTGITTTNQSTIDDNDNNSHNNNNVISLEEFANQHLTILSNDIQIFAEERLWSKYHKPRNLIMALLGEVGELSELLQYEGDDDDDDDNSMPLIDRLQNKEPEKLDKLSQELADVSIYALRLATVCNVIEPLKESLLLQQVEAE